MRCLAQQNIWISLLSSKLLPPAFVINSHLSGSLANSGLLNFGSKNNFSSIFVGEKGLADIYKIAISIFQFLSLFCYELKLHFGRTEVAYRDQKGKIQRFCEACYFPLNAAGRIPFSNKFLGTLITMNEGIWKMFGKC